MGRLLKPSDYGLLIALSSLFLLLGNFSTSFVNIFSRFSAKYLAKHDKESLSEVIYIGFKIVFAFSLLTSIILMVLLPFVTSFLHVQDLWLLILTYAAIVFSLVYSLPFGIIQGQMRFVLISFLNILQAVFKLVFGLLLVYLGLSLFGAILGISLSLLVLTLAVLFIVFRRYYIGRKEGVLQEKVFIKEFSRYSLPFFTSTIGITLLSSIDVILVRHFFTEIVSGQYAALSIMGKSIFYLTGPINSVFFPLIAYKKERKEKLFGTLMLGIFLITIPSILLSFVYFLFPHLVIKIFYPAEAYRGLSSYLGLFSLYILVFSLMWLLNNFFLAIGRTSIYKITLLGAMLEILLVVFFHQSLYQVIGILFFGSLLLIVSFLLYYLKNARD